MSARAMHWALSIIRAGVLENTLSPKLVLLSLADRADNLGKCWPSQNRTAKDLQISENTVKSATKYLAARGVVHVVSRKSEECNVNLSNVYLLQIPESFGTIPPAGSGGEVGQNLAHPVGQHLPQGGPKLGPEPQIEPKKSSSTARERGAADAAPHTKKARRVRPTGIVTWTAGDRVEAKRMEGETAAEELAYAVAEAHRRGREPLPGTVSSILHERSCAAAATKASARAAARIHQFEQASRARAEQEMAELMALQLGQASQGRGA